MMNCPKQGWKVHIHRVSHLSCIPRAVQGDVPQRSDAIGPRILSRSSTRPSIPQVPALCGGLSDEVLEVPIGSQRLALGGTLDLRQDIWGQVRSENIPQSLGLRMPPFPSALAHHTHVDDASELQCRMQPQGQSVLVDTPHMLGGELGREPGHVSPVLGLG